MNANLMEISSRCVRKFVDNFDPNKSSPDDQSTFARLKRDVVAFIVGGHPVSRSDNLALIAGVGSPPIGNPPIAPTYNRKQPRLKDCFEGRSSKNKRKERRERARRDRRQVGCQASSGVSGVKWGIHGCKLACLPSACLFVRIPQNVGI